MSRAKIEKLLALAYGTNNKEEAASAFGKAVAYANQAGIDLRTMQVNGAAKDDQPLQWGGRAQRGNFGDQFSYGGSDILESMRLRLALTKALEDHQLTKNAYQAEISAHSKTLVKLEETLIKLTDREAKIEGVRQDVLKLNEMCQAALKEKDVAMEHKDFEIAALKRQIDILLQK